MRAQHPVPFLALLLLASPLALPAADSARTAADIARDFPPFAAGVFTPAGLGEREPEPQIDYPAGAATRDVSGGVAVVSVLVGADGQPIDLLITRATDPAYARALRDRASTFTFKAATLHGTAIPARFDFAYRFEEKSGARNAMEVARNRYRPEGDALAPVTEDALDQPLEIVQVGFPKVPAAYQPPGDQPVRVYVTFFIDEEGRARLPTVTSAASPLLVPGAIKAVSHWLFKPPLKGGKPALVFTGRAVTFVPRNLAPASPAH